VPSLWTRAVVVEVLSEVDVDRAGDVAVATDTAVVVEPVALLGTAIVDGLDVGAVLADAFGDVCSCRDDVHVEFGVVAAGLVVDRAALSCAVPVDPDRVAAIEQRDVAVVADHVERIDRVRLPEVRPLAVDDVVERGGGWRRGPRSDAMGYGRRGSVTGRTDQWSNSLTTS
jgi:hypothetical protein